MSTRYVVLAAPRDLMEDVCSSANDFYKSEMSYFVLIVSHGIFQGPALKGGLNTNSLGWRISFDTSLILCLTNLDFTFKKQSFCVLGARRIFQVSLSKNYVLLSFLLNSIEDKHCRFIGGEQFRSMVPVSFSSRIQI